METATSPVFSFLTRPSLVDFGGHLAAVFFTSGCNFRCGFCHNAALLARRQEGLSWLQVEEACERFQNDWVDGAVISGGEPALQPDIGKLIAAFKRRGWAVKLDTNGSQPDMLRRCLPAADYVAMDVKTGPTGYAALTGWTDTGAIAESVALVRAAAVDYEFRTTVIDTVHTDDRMLEVGSLIRGARRYVLQPFLPREDLPDPSLRAVRRTSPDRLRALRDLMRPYAEEVVIRGE